MNNTDTIIKINKTEEGGAELKISKNRDDLLAAMTFLFLEMQSKPELVEILNKAHFISQQDVFKEAFKQE